MNLTEALLEREKNIGRPVRVGLVGAGQMGTGLAAQIGKIKGMERIMKLQSEPLKKLFYNYLVKRDKAGKDRLWDEIVVNNIKIKMLHSSEHGDWLEDTGYSFKTYGWEDGELVDMDQGNIEIAAYITKKSQELARKK